MVWMVLFLSSNSRQTLSYRDERRHSLSISVVKLCWLTGLNMEHKQHLQPLLVYLYQAVQVPGFQAKRERQFLDWKLELNRLLPVCHSHKTVKWQTICAFSSTLPAPEYGGYLVRRRFGLKFATFHFLVSFANFSNTPCCIERANQPHERRRVDLLCESIREKL